MWWFCWCRWLCPVKAQGRGPCGEGAPPGEAAGTSERPPGGSRSTLFPAVCCFYGCSPNCCFCSVLQPFVHVANHNESDWRAQQPSLIPRLCNACCVCGVCRSFTAITRRVVSLQQPPVLNWPCAHTVTQVAAWQLPHTGTGLLWLEAAEGQEPTSLVLAAASEQGSLTHLHVYELQLVRAHRLTD